MPVSEIISRRDSLEFARLVDLQKTLVPKLELEAQVFELFMRDYGRLSAQLEVRCRSEMPDLLFQRKEANRSRFKALQIDSVKNRFAFWLNELDVKFLSDANMARLNEGAHGGSSGNPNDRQTAAGF